MYRTYAIRITLLTTAFLFFVGFTYAQEGEVARGVSPVAEKINVQDLVRDDRSKEESIADSITDVKDIVDTENKKSEAINHDASRSNNTNSKVDPDEGGDTELDDSANSENKKSDAINHDASRSNNTNSKIDSSTGEGDDINTQTGERKRPGRVTYGNITLDRAFNSDSPYPDEVQEVEANQKRFLFGLIPMQVPVVARISKEEEIEVTQLPWYAFLLWR